MYTSQEIKEKIKLARAAGLSGWENLENPIAREVCNGIGAAWMWEWVRRLIGILCPYMVIVADIHDVDYTIGGTWWDRWKADFRFLCNGFRMAIYTGQYRQVAGKALFLWFCLAVGGWGAFNYHAKRGTGKMVSLLFLIAALNVLPGCCIPSDKPSGVDLEWYEYNRNYGWATGRKPVWVSATYVTILTLMEPVILVKDLIDKCKGGQ